MKQKIISIKEWKYNFPEKKLILKISIEKKQFIPELEDYSKKMFYCNKCNIPFDAKIFTENKCIHCNTELKEFNSLIELQKYRIENEN